MKALFGISIDELDKNGKRIRRHKVWHWSLFVRFLSAILFNRKSEFVKGFDFRYPLTYVMIFQAIEAMRMRLIRSGNNDELALFNNNVINTKLWSQAISHQIYISQKQTRIFSP